MTTTTSVYQVTVEELEALLSPRVVSRSLKDGLATIGKTPQDVGYEDIEKILKAQVYRQLQVTMPVNEAKTRIQDILTRIKNLEIAVQEEDASGIALEKQSEILFNLHERLKPFNLYFEWSEVQKLRALIQLLEVEQEAQREAGKLVADAREQLAIVEQKLEDELVNQGKELTRLEATLEGTKTLGGIKVRRLENLLRQIRVSHENRQLATAELERSKKLAIDLRKLMESSVVIGDDMPDNDVPLTPVLDDEGLMEAEPDESELLISDISPDIQARIAEIDLEGEGYSLESIRNEYKTLLNYSEELSATIDGYRQKLENGQSIADELKDIQETMRKVSEEKRLELLNEIKSIQSQVSKFDEEIVDAELKQAIQVGLGILETTLPKIGDVEHIRNLFRLAKEKQAERQKQRLEKRRELEIHYKKQAKALADFSETLAFYKKRTDLVREYGNFEITVKALKGLHKEKKVSISILSRAQEAQKILESAAAERAQKEIDRKKALLKALLSELRALPVPDSLKDEATTVENKIASYANNLDESYLADDTIDESAADIQRIKTKINELYLQDLQAILAKAKKYNLEANIAKLNQAIQNLDSNIYPRISELEAELSLALESLRQRQVNDFRQLTLELDRYKGLNLEGLDELHEFASDAQAKLAAGKLISGFDEIWLKLEALRATIEEKTANFIPQLDKALNDFESISKLNSEEVATVGIILKHLDEQRDSFTRVSVGVRGQLINSLVEAQELIAKLGEQLEATRAIAGKLASNNVLDSLFGGSSSALTSVSGDSKEPSRIPSEAREDKDENSQEEQTIIRSNNKNIDDFVERYEAMQAVSQILIFDGANIIAGNYKIDPAGLSNVLVEMDEKFSLLGGELKLKRHDMALFSFEKISLVVVWPNKNNCIVVITRDQTSLGFVVQQLKRDISEINELFGEASVL